jgi:hypothetical protein
LIKLESIRDLERSHVPLQRVILETDQIRYKICPIAGAGNGDLSLLNDRKIVDVSVGSMRTGAQPVAI